MKKIALFFLILTLVACRQGPDEVTPEAAPAATQPPAPTREVTTGVTILAEGQLVAVNPVLPLGFEVSGRVLTLNVKVGDVVSAGDVIATLDDAGLQDAVTTAELQVAQADLTLAQAQATLDGLLACEPDEYAIAVAEANLAAANATYEAAQNQDAAAGNSLTSAAVSVDQAERSVADAQEAYNVAHDPARDWELNDPWQADFLKAEREGTTRNLEFAQENLAVARSQYYLAVAGLNNDTALNAQVSVVQAEQALDQAQRGPTEAEIASAELQVAQAQIGLEQSQFSLTQAQNNLAKVTLTAPWTGTILAVDVTVGTLVGAGTPVVTLLDTTNIQFHTSNLSERDLAQVEPGQSVEITLKTYPATPLMGTVAGVAPQSSGMVGDAAVFTVMIDLAETELALRPGMSGRATITNE
jgi:HlyD family secretion protein